MIRSDPHSPVGATKHSSHQTLATNQTMLPPGESQPPPPPPPVERAVDLLRDLPTELLDKILAGLPACDVVRTSVLSPPWERQWESTAGLIWSSTVSDDTGARGSVANFLNRFLAGLPVRNDNGGA